MNQQHLYRAGEHGYHTFRIPTMLVTQEGTVLAFCEGRKNGAGDAGKIDVVLRRSADNGKTWGPMQVIAEEGTNTIGNPCPVQDRETGTIWVLLNRNAEDGHEHEILAGEKTRDVLVIKSDDDGLTWSEPKNITQDVKRPEWTWYAAGPCHAVQLQNGRLIVPCNHAVLNKETSTSGPYTAHVIYSDDHGQTWQLGGIVGEYTNECTLEEMPDGSIYMNMRSYHGKNQRAIAWSQDGGMTWSEIQLDEALVEPVCQGSVIADGQGGILFSNPSDVKRRNMTVKASVDGGRTWTVEKVVNEGPSAYSDLAIARDGNVLCLYESGEEKSYERITLVNFSRQ